LVALEIAKDGAVTGVVSDRNRSRREKRKRKRGMILMGLGYTGIQRKKHKTTMRRIRSLGRKRRLGGLWGIKFIKGNAYGEMGCIGQRIQKRRCLGSKEKAP